MSFANFVESIILYEKLYVDEYSFERSAYGEEKNPYHTLEPVFEDERLIVPLPSTESERL